jgi:hypothetical protein
MYSLLANLGYTVYIYMYIYIYIYKPIYTYIQTKKTNINRCTESAPALSYFPTNHGKQGQGGVTPWEPPQKPTTTTSTNNPNRKPQRPIILQAPNREPPAWQGGEAGRDNTGKRQSRRPLHVVIEAFKWPAPNVLPSVSSEEWESIGFSGARSFTGGETLQLGAGVSQWKARLDRLCTQRHQPLSN